MKRQSSALQNNPTTDHTNNDGNMEIKQEITSKVTQFIMIP